MLQWKCDAELDGKYRFGSVEVLCEGYAYPDDPYILAGSCGVSIGLAPLHAIIATSILTVISGI